MPRKAWIQKNRYCWNANLSEDTFLRLLRLYCTGYTCSDAARILTRFAKMYDVKKISRQTANRYYLLFGDYLYAMLPEEYRFADLELESEEGALEVSDAPPHYETQIILMGLYQAFYNKLDYRDEINKTVVGNTTQEIHKLLATLSRAKRGIPIKAFAGHFSLCIWLLLIQAIRPGESPAKALFELVRDTMEESPIGTFELTSIRVEKNVYIQHDI